ncbi:alpha/beta hydrolase [Roseateles aquae]|uniref:alpha/beta hydrolase n=1 Tax=Roseateles aquae TaxID=3077235 RepID=UPI0028EFB914|nr:alpha/beta hydrolase-fold protein [Paucibacter sp. APW11]
MPPSTPYVIAQTYALQSQVLNEKRELNIMLPEGYAEQPDQRYPVVYLLDGGQQEDFTHMAGAVQYASFSWVQRLPPVILVGISNTDRKRDMTFKASPQFVWPKWLHGYTEAYKHAGGSANFIRYIETEVQPFVERHFRTSGDRLLVGQSLAALLATEILLKKPALFNHYVIMSPSLWWDNGSLLKQAPQHLRLLPASPLKVYLAVGKEGPEMVKDARALAAQLRQHKTPQMQFVFEYLPKEDHGSILHPAALNAFGHFFPRPAAQ